MTAAVVGSLIREAEQTVTVERNDQTGAAHYPHFLMSGASLRCILIPKRCNKTLSWFSPRYHSIFCAHLGLQTCTQSPTGDGGVLTVQEREIRKELWNGSVHTWQVCSGVFGVSYSGIPNPQGENGRTPPPCPTNTCSEA